MTLKIITTPVTEKIVILFFIETFPKNSVILELLCSLIVVFSEDKKFNIVGSKVKVIINDVIKPKDIIQPKSIIGLSSLKINDPPSYIDIQYYRRDQY